MEIAYVGSYTTEKRGGPGSGGISVFKRGGEERWERSQLYEIMNPSYLAFGKDKRTLYAIQSDGRVVTAFSVNPRDGRLTYLNERKTVFLNGLFCETDPEFRFLFVASSSNTEPGGIVSIRLNEDGSLGGLCDIEIPTGTVGPLRHTQIGARPHQVTFDAAGRFLLEVDKGLDEVNSYSLNGDTGELTLISTTKFRVGSCPRHIVFHPDKKLAYLLTEWFGAVTPCAYQEGVLTALEVVPTIPHSYLGLKNLGAEIAIHPSGKFIYASNRGHNSIAAFRVLEGGGVEILDWYSKGLAKPRFFTLSKDGSLLYCANEEGNSVALFEICAETGALNYKGEVMKVPAPACILFKTL